MRKKYFRLLSILVAISTVLMLVAPVSAAVWTDQADYSPGSIVTISGDNSDGAGYVGNETVHVDVSGPNGYTSSFDTQADPDGAWSGQVTLNNDDSAVGDYSYTATGLTSGVTQSGTFTDTTHVDTNTTLNSISSPLTVGQGGVSFSGNVTSADASHPLPDGTYSDTVELGYDTDTVGSYNILATTVSLTVSSGKGTFSGTFTAPSPADTYYFVAKYVGGISSGTYDWKTSQSGYRTVTVNAAPTVVDIEITADSGQTKVYGTSDPLAFTYQITSGSLVSGDSLTGNLTRVAGEDVGTYAIQQGSLAINNVSGTTYNLTFVSADFTITQANAIITVIGFSGVYDGNPHGVISSSAVGVESPTPADLSSLLHVDSTTYTDVPGGNVSWIFDGNTNYKPASGNATVTITQANAIITVTGFSGVYDGNPHGVISSSAVGVESPTPTDLSSLLHVDSTTYTDVPGGNVSWTFDGNTDYKPASGNATVTITQANAIITVTGFSGVYDGNPHGVISSSAVGVESPTPADLSSLLHVDSTTYTDVPGGNVSWTFDGNTDYKPASGNATVTITQADAVITVTGFSGVYDGDPHGVISSSAVGVESPTPVNLSSLLHVDTTTYTDVPGGNVSWTFDGNTNYKPASGNATVTITQAHTSMVLTVNPPIVVAGNSITLTATLSSSDSPSIVGGKIIAFTLDKNPFDGTSGPYSLGNSTTNGSGVASLSNSTSGWLPDVYEVTATYAGDSNIVGCDDDATLVVADPGAAATGGGFIQDNGRLNFGFTVKLVEGTTNTYKGQFLLVNNGKWRVKGTLNSYGTLNGVGYASGSGALYRWDSSVGPYGDWILVQSGVNVTLTFTDNGSGKKATADTFGVQIDYPFGSCPWPSLGNPNTSPLGLKGGNIDIKSANNTTDGNTTTPPPTGKGKNK
jgi:hypothetical protein